MSLEVGGRSDKYGNEYEKKYLLKLLFRLISGKLTSIIVEPLGEHKDSVEFISKDAQGSTWYHQCKAGNNTKTAWSPSDLNSHRVFSRSKAILLESPNNRYEFISPLPYGELAELCKRARTNRNPEELIHYQLSNDKIRKVFLDCSNYYGLDPNDPQSLVQLTDILSRSYFETVHDGNENANELSDLASVYFFGVPSSICTTLENYADSQGLYGREITSYDVIAYMERSGFRFRSHFFADNIVSKISEINDLFYDSYLPINGNLFHREATDDVLESTKQDRSVVLHGKAGMGKSGCVQEIINNLKSNHIPFLALKLDKNVPKGTTDTYGQALGLTQSPMYCLYHVSQRNPCVFIIDQLDSLRWTSHHSSNALDVCKQLIQQADTLNQNENAHISLILISRTFDLETDAGLQSLFETDNNNCSMTWSKVQVSEFTHDEVEKIIGAAYNTYPSRLQKLLQTPSTLYIWTRLEKHEDARFVSTSHDLMQKWWDQILCNCAESGLDRSDIISVKDKIVSTMSQFSSFSLQKRLFSDRTLEVEKLISEGLLIQTDHNISFVHQSFLDFFAYSEMITQIYSGKDAAAVIGDYDSQTPVLKYRLQAVLQQIIESDERIFIATSRDILQSDNIRYYFKLTVFEVAGQYNSPSAELIDFMSSLLHNDDWHNVVFRTVFYGHLPYISGLDKSSSYDWMNHEGLVLLSSVYEKSPDYVIGKLPCAPIRDRQLAFSAYDVLSPNLSFDTQNALAYRLSILESYPELYNRLWALNRLVETKSANLLVLLKSLVKHSSEIDKDTYIGKGPSLIAYSKKYYIEIIQSLLPTVCEITARFDPRISTVCFNHDFRIWTPDRYHQPFARTIVAMIKIAFDEYYTKDAEACKTFISHYNGQASVVYHGIISETVLNMDVSDSDFALRWLCSDVQHHMFIYTENQDDYLALTKEIIKKFSPFCSAETFSDLENTILQWSESSSDMIRRYKTRIEVSQNYTPVYYAYWGYLQKELLPMIEQERLSKQSKDLLQVLNRNSWISVPHYHCGISASRGGSVISPVYHRTDKLSDRTWIKIISEPNDKMNRHFSRPNSTEYFIESTHSAFSSSLSAQARKEPARFAKLALQFPDHCYSGYITGVLGAMYNPDKNAQPADMDCILPLINRYICSDDLHIIREILSLIEHLSKNDWPDNIIDYVCNTALNTATIDSDKEYSSESESAESLHIAAINCVPGCAIETMSKLLSEHPELVKRFIPVFEQLSTDLHPAVRFALMYGVFSCYSIDPDFSLRLFRSLLSQDIRILGFPNVWNLILEDRFNHEQYYSEKLVSAAYSGIKGLNEGAAGLLCAYSVYFDNTLLPKVCSENFNDQQINEICNQAVFSFSNNDYHEDSKAILLYYITQQKKEIICLSKLFRDNHIDIERDEDFMIQLLRSKQEPYIVYAFLKYINEQDQDITRYLNTLSILSESLMKNKDKKEPGSAIHELIVSVIKIYDRNKYHPDNKRICLDIWDNIYQNCYEYIKSISDILDESN